MNWIGRFDERHNPRLNFNLISLSDGQHHTFDGIIDTGFTGFVQIPLPAAAIMGIISQPNSVGTVTLANGTIQQVLLKQMPVTVEEETVTGVAKSRKLRIVQF